MRRQYTVYLEGRHKNTIAHCRTPPPAGWRNPRAGFFYAHICPVFVYVNLPLPVYRLWPIMLMLDCPGGRVCPCPPSCSCLCSCSTVLVSARAGNTRPATMFVKIITSLRVAHWRP